MAGNPPGGAADPPPPCTDARILRLALQLADCRPDLSPEQRRHLAGYLAHLARTYGRVDPHD